MKQINISVSFDDEKLRALNKYLKKKDLTAEAELAAALLHLYEKHVPAAVREYIDEDDAVVPAKPKRTAKQTVPKKVEEPDFTWDTLRRMTSVHTSASLSHKIYVGY